MFTLKKICFVAIVLFFTNTLLAQDADSDGDGVLDSEDVCPMDKGTKANKGCPAIDTLSSKPTSENMGFITDDDFVSIMNTICKYKQELYKDNTVQNGSNIIKTTLPKTGADKQFPVYYATNGKGRFFTYISLSSNENDFLPAVKLIDERIKKNAASLCIGEDFFPYTVPYEVKITTTNDTATFIFQPSEYQMRFFRMMVYKYNAVNGTKIITLRVETISNEAVIQQIKSKGITDNTFCKDVSNVIAESHSSFKNIKEGVPTKAGSGSYLNSKLLVNGFEETSIQIDIVPEPLSLKTSSNEYQTSRTFKNDDAGAQLFFNQLTSKLDGCLNFSARYWEKPKKEKTTLFYKVSDENGSVKIRVVLLNLGDIQGKSVSVVSLTVFD